MRDSEVPARRQFPPDHQLDRFAIACVGQFGQSSHDFTLVAAGCPYTQLKTGLGCASGLEWYCQKLPEGRPYHPENAKMFVKVQHYVLTVLLPRKFAPYNKSPGLDNIHTCLTSHY